jgi:ribonuclease-3
LSFRGFIRSKVSPNKDFYLSIKNVFGFYPGNIYLYKLALRHKSASKTKINGLKINNERLEYLGDAILGAVIADYLFKKFPYKSEGFLTQMRSKIVSRISLNRLSIKLGLDKLILSDSDQNYRAKSAGGDAFEAIVGAIYLDKGYYFTRRTIINRIINVHFDIEHLIDAEISYKSKILEWAQKEKREICFEVIEEIGEKQNKQFKVAVKLDGKTTAESIDYSIKGAEKIAAEKAWNILELS